jgi:4-amino-4-deoxy-L-arabinose transferase-like glycosyltransferase
MEGPVADLAVQDAKAVLPVARRAVETAPAGSSWAERWRLRDVAGDLLRLLILILLTASIRLWLICNTEVAARDSIGFIRYALELESQPWDRVLRESLQHPGYPAALLAISYPVRQVLGGTTPQSMQLSAQLTSALASLLLIVPMFYLGRELFDRRVGFWATVLFQCLPVSARVMSDGLSEATFFLFLTSALWMAAGALRTQSAVRFAACGVFGSLAYLTRPEGGLVLLATGLVLPCMGMIRRGTWLWRRVAKCTAALTLAAVIIGAPYVLIIGSLSNKPTPRKMLDPEGNDATPMAPQLTRTLGAPISLSGMPGRHQPVMASLLGIYAPTDLNDRHWWAVYAIGNELSKGYQYGACVPLALGLWWFRRRLWGVPGAWVLGTLCLLQGLILWRLAVVAGYVSDRHVQMLVLCGSFIAAAASIHIANRLAGFAVRYWGGTECSPRRLAVRALWSALLLLIAMTMFGLPEALKPLHGNRAGHRQAGLWLAQHSQPADEILDPFCWAHYYAGRVFMEGKTPEPPPGYTPMSYVVIEHSDHDHIRLPQIAQSLRLAARGSVVYHWPENKSVEEAKVLVYGVPPEKSQRLRRP